MARPQKSHLLVAKRILKYIKNIQDYKKVYKNNIHDQFIDYVDCN